MPTTLTTLRMKPRLCVLRDATSVLLGASLLSGQVARAQTPDTTTLKPVVVSATKTPVSRASLSQSVTVLNGADLRARGVTRVADALREIPGATVVQSGSIGSVATLFLRGGESRYTKVLIDGVAVNTPGGFFDLSHLTTDNIDRIEIVRGPASVAHGADAVTGVVQIFTREGGNHTSLGADARGGTYRTRQVGVDASGSAGFARYSFSGGHHQSKGVFPFNNDYRNGTLSALVALQPRPAIGIKTSARYTTAEFHYPTDFTGAPVDSNAYRVQHRLTVGVDGTARISPLVTVQVLLGSNDVADLTEDTDAGFNGPDLIHSTFRSRAFRRAAEGRIALGISSGVVLNLGTEYVRERESSTNIEGPVGHATVPASSFVAHRSNAAGYAELVGGLASRWTYTLAARLDDNSDYDRFTTYRAGMSVAIAEATRLRSSLSTAFNAPAFNQLRPTLYTVGNPDLDPEKSRSYEVGLEQSLYAGEINFAATYFNQRFTDLIQYVAGGPPSFRGSYGNLAGAQSNGYELELEVSPRRRLSGRATYSQATPRVTHVSRDYSSDLQVGQALIRRPAHSGSATLRHALPLSGFLSATAMYVGKRPDLDFREFPSPVVTLPAYTRIDIAGAMDVFRTRTRRSALSLNFRLENAFDKAYEDVLNFRTAGRTILLGARYSASL